MHSDLGHAKVDKLRENEAKREEAETEPGHKKGDKSHFDINFIS